MANKKVAGRLGFSPKIVKEKTFSQLLPAVWYLVFLISTGLIILSWSIIIEFHIGGCNWAICQEFDIADVIVEDLQAAGISLTGAIAMQIGIEMLAVLPFFLVTLILYRSNRLGGTALLGAFMLPSFAAVAIGPASMLIPLNNVIGILAKLLMVIAQSLFLIFFFVFPNGKFYPRWTLWVAGLWTAIFILTIPFDKNPFDYVGSFWIAFPLIAVGTQIHRYRSFSSPIEKQQTKWVVIGFVSSMSGFSILVSVSYFTPESWFGAQSVIFLITFNVLIYVLLSLIPISIGIAILRYNLWNIDLVINRTLVAAALTAMLVLFFMGASWAVNTLLVDMENSAVYSAVAAALLFGVVFQPARKNIQRFVDRRFYRIMIDYQKTPADLEPDFDTSQTTFGHYKNLVLVGRGGMGEVFRASAPDVRDPVAIKIMPPNLVRDATQRKRFEREAQLAASLKHDNIVKVIEYGAMGDVPYIVMEYINGPDLADHLRKVKRIPLKDALPTIRQVAAALDYAHKRGYVHRDIKPSNIMLEEKNGDARAVLMDFGIAKILGEATLATRSGFLGTLDYIAPEQIQSAADIDPRADVYSFGVLVYQMLSGRLPFKSNNPGGMLLAHLTQPAPDVREITPEIPHQVAEAIQKAMAKLPAERFSSAGEFAIASISPG